MKILLVTPARRGTRHGNRVSADRWASILRSLGHRVQVRLAYDGERCDLLVALHARRSADSMQAFKAAHPGLPLILVLTGTDVYHDIHVDAHAQLSLELADRIVALQPLAREEMPAHLQYKLVPIIQSALPTSTANGAHSGTFDVSVVGHLRAVKDPFRAAIAARMLPQASKLRVLQVGGALTDGMAKRARDEVLRNKRYQWLGNVPRWRARRIMKASKLLVVSSKLEGGANVVSEALADGVPVLGSHIPGNVGLLGEDYPGYYPSGDTRRLARLLSRAEMDPTYLEELRRHMAQRADMVRPETERAGWESLVNSLSLV
jgi:putative glycosyltransferase (TIGR04348 family)